MIVPPIGNEDGDVKEIVTGTAVVPTRRFCNLMPNVSNEIWPKIWPDATAAEGTVSVDDSKVT